GSFDKIPPPLANVLRDSMMRIALCQLNPTVGDFPVNVGSILAHANRARAEGAEIAVFPELAVSGYPPKDLLDRPAFIEDGLRALDGLIKELPSGLTAVVGFIDRKGSHLYNAAALVGKGGLADVVHKRLLPTYDVFDEDRYFEAGTSSKIFKVGGF